MRNLPKDCRYCSFFDKEGSKFVCTMGNEDMDCKGKDFELYYEVMQLVQDRTRYLGEIVNNAAVSIDNIITEAHNGDRTVYTAYTLIGNECMRLQSAASELGILII